MPNPALSDQLALQQLFQEPFSPLATYGQGSLAIAMQQRQERARAAQQAQEQQFQAQNQREQSALVMARQQEIEKMRLDAESKRQEQQQRFQMQLQDTMDQRAQNRLKSEWEHTDKAGKEKKLNDLKGQAVEAGIPLPSADLTQDEQFEVLHRDIGKANAQKAMDLIAAGRRLNDQLTAATGATDKERAADTVTRFLASPDSAKLTADELKRLQNDPSQIFQILARLQKDTSKAGKKTAEAVKEAWFGASQQSNEFYASKVKNPELLAKIRGDYDLNRIAINAALSNPNLPSGIFSEMFAGGVDKAKEITQTQQQQQSRLPPLPTPGAGAGITAPGAAAPAGPAPNAMRLPPNVLQDPYGSLLSFIKQEQQGRPAGGAVMAGVSPFSMATGPTPATDLFYDQLGSTLGLQPQQIGSSALTRSPAAQVQAGLTDPGMISRLNAIPPVQQNQIAGRVLNQIVSDPSNPAHTRFMKWLQDNAATQNAIAPTAFPSPTPFVVPGVTGMGF